MTTSLTSSERTEQRALLVVVRSMRRRLGDPRPRSILKDLGRRLLRDRWVRVVPLSDFERDAHLAYALDQLERNVDVWPEGKWMRWFGFVQGAFFSARLMSLEGIVERTREALTGAVPLCAECDAKQGRWHEDTVRRTDAGWRCDSCGRRWED